MSAGWIQRVATVKLTAALDTALFYVIIDLVFGVTITWPLVLAVAWAVDTCYGIEYRRANTPEEKARRAAIALLTKPSGRR
jgi:uncharacterized membrane protein YGL010W